MKLLVFQHIDCEHPGSLRQYLKEDGIKWDAIQFDQGDKIPALEDYDALWVMGGPMDVWDTDEYPWLIDEKRAIFHWVKNLQKPYLGLCLGHQLLADALDGTCGLATPPEIGILDITLSTKGSQDPIMNGLPIVQSCLQWHSVEVSKMPENSICLASSPSCAIQAMRVGKNAWSMQYHVEVEPDTVDNWGKIPAYKKALETSLGENALSKMVHDAKIKMPEFSENSQKLYKNFMALAKK